MMKSDSVIPSIEGLWQMIHAEFESERAPELVTAKTTLEFAAGDYTVRFDGEVHDRGNFSTEPSAVYSVLILRGVSGTNAGRTIPAIYQCVGDRLRICYGLTGVGPIHFSTEAGSQRYLATYRRAVL